MNIGNILKESLRESQFSSTGKCTPVEMYVFGSSTVCEKFNDIDLLFIVLDDILDKVRLYDVLHDLCKIMSHRINYIIDFTILTQTEDRALEFEDRAKAVFVDFVNIPLCHE
jgi:predicted nucleotidyltransferase